MRHVKLPDLLIEVDNQLGFTRNFLTPAQREEPSPEDICAVLAAVMAHGCNLGVYTMAQLTSDVTYDQLKRIGDWHLTEEAQRSALAELVSAITDLDTSSRWGEGIDLDMLVARALKISQLTCGEWHVISATGR
jgi:hypothetical protein